jgi:transposase, IS5 family
MIIDRYSPVNLFALVPKLYADFEPELRDLDRLLDDDQIVQQVKAAMARRASRSLSAGRHSTPVEVILRLLVVKRLSGWSYEEVEHFVGDSLVLRQFCRISLQPVPDDTTLIRWANLIGPETVARLNDRVVDLARARKVTRGRKLRVDSTVVETTIHHPTDSRIVGDGVRVLSRLLRRAKAVIGHTCALGQDAFRTRIRSVRRLAQQIHRLARRKGEAAAEEMQQASRRLLTVARQSQRHAACVRDSLRAAGAPAARLLAQLDQFLPRVEQAITQADRRVLRGETVPASAKIVSLFEPHTQVIQRHKPGKVVEFGRKLWLDELDGGIISRSAILDAAGLDHPYLAASLTGHQQRFGHPPWLLAGDRGVWSAANELLAQAAGVKRVVLPHAGKASADRAQRERSRWFRRGFRFRAGIEGRISVLRRCYELDRCRDHGEAGMGRWVGWGIVAANLATTARTLARRPPAGAARVA